MARGGWPWGAAVAAASGVGNAALPAKAVQEGLRVWNRLDDWRETAAEAPLGAEPVEPAEARARLAQLLGAGAEERPEQAAYAAAASVAFAPREAEGEPRVALAEAGTGVGKTLGYIAPASVWTEKNQGAVWISTYTRNLQRQLDGEMDRLYADPAEKAERVVIRKGRENYLCLLNFEEAVNRLGRTPGAEAVPLGLMARWAGASRDGDMLGGDFPAWIAGLLGRGQTVDLTDTRGECVYSACIHYRKCFIERSVRRARSASMVIANHALVMIQAARGGETPATRIVFDEGHHLFDAADAAFSAHLTGHEAAELRRWLLGVEEGARGRARSRGLRARAEDLVAGNEKAMEMLEDALKAARVLPGPGWRQRVSDGRPKGPAEAFLVLVRGHVYARAADADTAYSLEALTAPPIDGVVDAAAELEQALDQLAKPLVGLSRILTGLLDAEAGELETAQRQRLEALSVSLERRGGQQLQAWRAMLQALDRETPEEFIDWFSVERMDGRDLDIGHHRHWLDPMRVFIEVVAEPAHGLLVTSASLRDGTGDVDADWAAAEARTGARHLDGGAERTMVPSPFNYAEQTRLLVIGDVNRNSADQVAAAYRELFLAAGGGGLGLFTAIARLRAVHDRIQGPLDEAGLSLLAQHVDGLDTGTLVDIFRAERDSCLLGTDAVRDGVDVPGHSLRLIVFDRVPWPRPDILHRARREHFGGRAYDEMLTRLRLKQAFGRLVRQAGDRGVFVMLDRGLPSRLAGAFPEGVKVQRVGLKDAVAETRAFLAAAGNAA